MSDVIWALDQRERCIVCPSKPVANAVVLYLSEDGTLARDEAGALASDGVMAASVNWPGVDAELSEDDWLDLEDAATGLQGLAQVIAIVGEGRAGSIAKGISSRVGDIAYVGGESAQALAHLVAVAPA